MARFFDGVGFVEYLNFNRKLCCMITDNPSQSENSLAIDTVLSCVQAINNGDYAEARTYVSDDMIFIGVMGSTDGGDDYIDYLKHKKIKYHLQKVFALGDDVCLLYDLEMGSHMIYGCGWYHLREGKINMLRVVFDPRPMLK
jgi:SnoaL-like protein